MILQCDLHIHTALSPCADLDMTPGNIVSMARLQGIDVIAITDHQTCGNCASAMAIAKQQGVPLVIPGIEVESQEEIHLICLLPDLPAANKFEKYIRDNLPPIANRTDIFGEQLFFDTTDQPAGCEDLLLLQACQLSIDEIVSRTLELGGVCLPAHIDRESHSILSVLGAIPPGFPAASLEISPKTIHNDLITSHPDLAGYRLIRSSDAHHLSDLAVAGWPLEVKKSGLELTAADVIRAVKSSDNG